MSRRGVTIMEVIVASVLASFLAIGVMMAFMASTKGTGRASTRGQAMFYVEQTLEGYRNHIACRQGNEAKGDSWYNTNCKADPPTGWVAEAMPTDADVVKFPNATRQYKAEPADCDGVNGTGDCMKLTVKVSWDSVN